MDFELDLVELLFILGGIVLMVAFYFIIKKVHLELKENNPSQKSPKDP
jgi:hypothetical protein